MSQNLRIEMRRGDEQLVIFWHDVEEYVQLSASAEEIREYLTTEALGLITPGETTVFILTAVEEKPEAAPTPRAMPVAARPQGDMHELWPDDPWVRWRRGVILAREQDPGAALRREIAQAAGQTRARDADRCLHNEELRTPNTLDYLIGLIEALGPSDRRQFFEDLLPNHFCLYCGSPDSAEHPKCYCMHDE